ncbi:MAG: hypothetical protein CTY25_14470 [Methylobacterium sp.]|nr:MAG: hypothetical protein CTY25_14470 [Methylobacterium sp.]
MARTKREEVKRLLASGIDPVEQSRIEKANKAIAEANSRANTFSAIAAELLAKKRREGRLPTPSASVNGFTGSQVMPSAIGRSPRSRRLKFSASCRRWKPRGISRRRGACAQASVRSSGLPSPPGGQSRTRHSLFVEPSQSRMLWIGPRS